jgi:hypothetical protein
MKHWPVVQAETGPITSVASWRGAYGPVEYEGRTFGLRVHEFRKFVGLPAAVPSHRSFQLALDIHAAEGGDIDSLTKSGWQLIDPKVAAGSANAYREYIRRSSAEFCVAKNMYVQARTGWFSDRSAVYLASGKPVIAQETGWSSSYPAGEGLMAFSTPDQAAAAVEAVFSDYQKHALAAREIALHYFDSDLVLSGLLDELGLV